MSLKRRIVNMAVIVLVTMTLAGLVVGSAEANLPSCSNCIEAGDIAAGAVRASELYNDLDDTINANDIAAGGVAGSEIKNGSVTASDVASSVATQVELDGVENIAYAAGLVASGRVASAGSLTSTFGFARFTSSSYDATDNRYELLVEVPYVDEVAPVVTPSCSTATSWYSDTDQTSTGSGYVYVYLKDAAGDPEQCDFSILLG